MYNRYSPQPDGSYRRNRIQEAEQQPLQRPIPIPPPPPVKEPESPPCGNCVHRPPPRRPAPPPRQEPIPVSGFLKQLLPKNFDTEDLLVVLLLLLMAGDCREQQNSALLTLVLYLFL